MSEDYQIIGRLVKDLDSARKKCACLKLKLDGIYKTLRVAAQKIAPNLPDEDISYNEARLTEYPSFDEYKQTIQEYLEALIRRNELERSLKQYGITG